MVQFNFISVSTLCSAVNKYSRIVLGLSLVLRLTYTATAQSVAIKFPITVQDSRGNSSTLYIGVHPLATYCRDADTLKNFCDEGTIWERSAPPVPVIDTLFDARLTDPRGFNGECMDQGLFSSIHQFVSTSQIDTFQIDFQNTIGYPFTFSWPPYLSYYCDSMRMKDVYGSNLLNVNMLSQTSVQVVSTFITSVRIVMYGLKQHDCPPGISGTVYNDVSGDGVRDAGEPGLAGWKITLSGTSAGSVLTDADGFYSFKNLATGLYTVTEVPPSGWTQTAPPSGSYTISFLLGNFYTGNDFGNFYGGSIGGTVFNDQNKNGARDFGEPGLAGWTINLSGPQGAQTTTDVNGNYSFTHLLPGTYTVSEVQQDDWVQVYPAGAGTYSLVINNNEDLNGNDFGNVAGVQFTGNSGGNYSDPSNWPNNQVPTPDDAVIISTEVIKDSPLADSIKALRIAEGGKFTFQTSGSSPSTARKALASSYLIVQLKVQIDENATLQFLTGDTAAGMTCYGDWVNNGTFSAGSSTISFQGTDQKFIASKSSGGGGGFYNLNLLGPGTGTSGNLTVTNTLTLENSLTLHMKDTLFVENSSPDAINDSGRILAGTIVRRIAQGETGAYRFESPQTFLQFKGGGTYPASVAITTFEDSASRAFNLPWQVVGGTDNQSEHTVAADGITQFSTWSMGDPGLPVGSFAKPSVSRFYRISNSGGSGFVAHMQLRYNPSELFPSTNESALQLLRGPVIVDTVANRWNLVSPPLITDDTLKGSLFPTASSPAFAYDGGYGERLGLRFGQGYWLKFPAAQPVQIVGSEVEEESLAVKKGWNLIGAISFPVSAASVKAVSPASITSQFWGYRNGGYRIADSLKPLRGYWVRVSANGQLVLSTTAGHAMFRSASSQLENFSSLSFHDASGYEQKLYIGLKTDADPQQYELPPVPPAGIFDVRFLSQRVMEATNSREVRTIPVLISSAGYPVTVSWEMKAPNVNASLIINGKKIPMPRGARAQIKDPATQVVLELSGSPALPKEVQLGQNYPNPFNPNTTIQYLLPADSKVTLRVYNVLGQVVATLTDGIESAGYKAKEWNGSNVSSGVYFYRINVTDVEDPGKSFTQVKKMLLLK